MRSGTAAAQERAHPRHQLGDGERLDDVIVGADRKAAHPLGFLSPRGQHDDRQRARALARPQPAADFKPRHAGQHPIEYDEIGRVLGEPQLGLVAAFDALDDIAFRFEIVAEKQSKVGFILDDQNPWRGSGVAAGALPADLIHVAPPAASLSMSKSCRPCGRSEGIASPVTR